MTEVKLRPIEQHEPERTEQPERRRWDRLPISVPFFIRADRENGDEWLEFATALNLSGGGALLASRRYLDPGTSVRLEIPVALVHKAQLPRSTSLLHARVLRCTPDRQYFLLGFEFKTPLLDGVDRAQLQ